MVFDIRLYLLNARDHVDFAVPQHRWLGCLEVCVNLGLVLIAETVLLVHLLHRLKCSFPCLKIVDIFHVFLVRKL